MTTEWRRIVLRQQHLGDISSERFRKKTIGCIRRLGLNAHGDDGYPESVNVYALKPHADGDGCAARCHPSRNRARAGDARRGRVGGCARVAHVSAYARDVRLDATRHPHS